MLITVTLHTRPSLSPQLPKRVMIDNCDWPKASRSCSYITARLSDYCSLLPWFKSGKCRQLVDAQHTEADRALLGRGDFVLRKGYASHRTTLDLWRSMSERQKERLRNDCFRLQSAHTTSVSTDGLLTVNSRACAGKKMNQRKRRCAERSATSGKRHRAV